MNKNIFTITLSLIFSFFLSGCQEEVESGGGDVQGKELTFSSFIQPRATLQSRAIGDEFFNVGGEIDVAITSTNPEVGQRTYQYVYGQDRIFRGNPGYHFTLDDNYISSLSAVWPTAAIRQQGFRTDQRELEDYKSADWMTASLSIAIDGIMPTDAPVPLNFTRENVMLDFELVGQNTKGLDIESLLIELQTGGQSLAYWAYCGNPNGHAELILEGGSAIFSPENYLIGRITVSNNDNYTIIFPQTDLVLEAGKRYLVTLTPQGYYMNAYVIIAGFADSEEGIGIPLQVPIANPGGGFTIQNPIQLITLSYLIRNYEDGSFNWAGRAYTLADDFTLTQEDADRYIPIPADQFTGSIRQGGEDVETIPYGDGQELNLFTNENDNEDETI